MLTEVLRQALERVDNRFHLAVLAAERAAQLLQGARPAVDNPNRERVMKVALREIADEKIRLEGEHWVVDRPPMALEQVFNLSRPVTEDGLLGLGEADLPPAPEVGGQEE